ncbi:MAG: hypothetical protein AAFQ80_03195 [Cyanobacteria bacterium J06621_8]
MAELEENQEISSSTDENQQNNSFLKDITFKDVISILALFISAINLIGLVFSYQVYVKNRRDNIRANFITNDKCSTKEYQISLEHHRKWKTFKEKRNNIDAVATICFIFLDYDKTPALIIEKKNIEITKSKQEFIQESENAIRQLHNNEVEIVSTNSDVYFDSNSGYEIIYILDRGRGNSKIKRLEIGKLDQGQVFYVTYSAKKKEYRKYEKEVKEIIDSIDIREIELD